MMEYNIINGSERDVAYICDKLVEYNLKQVPKTQENEFVNIRKKILDKVLFVKIIQCRSA